MPKFFGGGGGGQASQLAAGLVALSDSLAPTLTIPPRVASQVRRVSFDIFPRRRADAGAGNWYTYLNKGFDPDPGVSIAVGTNFEEQRVNGRWHGIQGGGVDGNFGIGMSTGASSLGRPECLPRYFCLFDANDVSGDVAAGDRAFWLVAGVTNGSGNFGRSTTPGISDYVALVANDAIGGANNWKFTYRAASGARNIVDTGIPFPTSDQTVLTWLEFWFPTPTTVTWYIATPTGFATGTATHGISTTLALYGMGLNLGYNGGFRTTGYYKLGCEMNP
jgi:hypothetical protein